MTERKTFIQYALLVGFFAIGLVSWYNRFYILDSIRLIGFEPSASIQQLSDDSGMSDEGERLFFAAQPQLLVESEFDTICQFEELGLVLGCYSGRDIYVLDVLDEDLELVETVTAAHEMLHVVYARLSDSEKTTVARLIDRQIEQTTNERILESIDAYRADPQSDIYNEAHSIFGTEYDNLLPELENHYRRYFSDRGKVLSASEEYEKVFIEIEESIEEFDAELKSLSRRIDELELDAGAAASQITTERAELDALLESNNVDAYNARVPGFNLRVDRYNESIKSIRSLVAEYNSIVKVRNESVVDRNDLIKSLDSDLETI